MYELFIVQVGYHWIKKSVWVPHWHFSRWN